MGSNCCLMALAALLLGLRTGSAAESSSPHVGVVAGIEGLAEGVNVRRAGAREEAWDKAYTNQVLYAGGWFRTGPRSRALIQFCLISRICG